MQTERDIAISIMADSFTDNPAIAFSIGKKGDFERRKYALAKFLYGYCKRRNGVFLSADQKGVICFYHSDVKTNLVAELWAECILVFSAIGLQRAYRVWKRSHLIRKKQQAYQPYIHCWYIGIAKSDRGQRTAFELNRLLMDEALQSNRPVLAETMIIQNKRVFERLGFVEYGRVEIQNTTTFLLLKKQVR